MSDLSPYIRTIRSLWARLQGKHFDGERDLYSVCGYPRVLNPENYLAEYLRQGIGSRIVDAFPDATWREPPTIKATSEDADGTFATDIEQKLVDKFELWSILARLDRLTGLGHYGALLLGVGGGQPLDKPMTGGSSELIYLSPHGERSAEITRWNDDHKSPRFGKPYSYRMTIGVSWTGLGGSERSVNVHHSRVLHVAEKPLDDESIGQPRLERIWNRLMDLDKLLGGSAEVYWQNAAPLRQWVATDPEAQWEPEEKADMKAQIEAVMHKLSRDVRLRGVKGEIMAASFEDPANAIDKQLDMISGATGIPKRILIGSERGELASEQDENNWAARISERREQFATPHIIRPFIDKMIEIGYLTKPAGGYDVEWPESDALGEEKRAEIAKTKAEAVQAYISVPGAESVIALQEFRRWLGEEEESEFPMPEQDLAAVDGELDETDPQASEMFRQVVANAKPRTLYVRRNVLNADEIRAWAAEAGFKKRVPAGDMQVTIAFSRKPVDWISVGSAWTADADGELVIPAGGPRVVESLGESAIVLMFASNEISWRHEEIKRAGASWDFKGFQPHVTITYEADAKLLDELRRGKATIEPYRGEIRLGPEIFEPVTEDWSDSVVENRRVVAL